MRLQDLNALGQSVWLDCDLQVLRQCKRALSVHLGPDGDAGLEALTRAFDAAQGEP